jgi:hypothetical protein
MCSGPHDDIYEIAVAGIFAPYTDLVDKTGPINSASHKYNIMAVRNSIFPAIRADNPVKLQLYVPSYYVIPMEIKFGANLYNYYGARQCETIGGATVSCTNTAAEYGLLYWVFGYSM